MQKFSQFCKPNIRYNRKSYLSLTPWKSTAKIFSLFFSTCLQKNNWYRVISKNQITLKMCSHFHMFQLLCHYITNIALDSLNFCLTKFLQSTQDWPFSVLIWDMLIVFVIFETFWLCFGYNGDGKKWETKSFEGFDHATCSEMSTLRGYRPAWWGKCRFSREFSGPTFLVNFMVLKTRVPFSSRTCEPSFHLAGNF